MMLGGFAASAQLPAPTITPADGSNIYGWPIDPDIIWDMELNVDYDKLITLSHNGEVVAELEPEFQSGSIEGDGWVPGPPSILTLPWGNYAFLLYGDLTLTVPAGIVYDDSGNSNEEIVLNYTHYDARGGDFYPIPNDGPYSASQLSQFKIVYDYDIEPVYPQPSVTITLTPSSSDPEGIRGLAEMGVPFDLDPDLISYSTNSIILDLSGLTDGNWNINVPGGMAKITDLEDTYTMPEDFTIIINNDLANYLPSPFIEVTEEGDVYLYWNEEIEYVNGDGPVYGSYKEEYSNSPVDASFVIQTYFPGMTEGNTPEIYNNALLMREQVPYSGWYTISIPAGVVKNAAGLENAAISIGTGIYVNPQNNVVYGMSPVYDINTIMISWSNATSVSINSGDAIEIYNPSNIDETYYLYANSGYRVSGKLVIVDLSNLDLDEGVEYWMSVREGTFWVETEYEEGVNEGYDFPFIYEPSSINTLESAKAADGIYNLQGVKVGNDVNSLNPGMYIINGKKVIIKK